MFSPCVCRSSASWSCFCQPPLFFLCGGALFNKRSIAVKERSLFSFPYFDDQWSHLRLLTPTHFVHNVLKNFLSERVGTAFPLSLLLVLSSSLHAMKYEVSSALFRISSSSPPCFSSSSPTLGLLGVGGNGEGRCAVTEGALKRKPCWEEVLKAILFWSRLALEGGETGSL